MSFNVTLTTVLIMLAYAIPGFALVKAKLIAPSSISSFAALLLYVFAPFQTIYAIQQISYSPDTLLHMGVALGLGLVLMGGVMALVYFVLRSRQEDVAWRICTVSATMGNCGFIGLPLVQALLPHYPQGAAYASSFFVGMGILMWTASSFIMTRDKKYIRPVKILLNPNSISMLISLALMFAGIRFTGQVGDMVTLLGKMATPMCMLILGMRLAVIPLRPMFTRPVQYLAVGLKLIVFPLIVLAAVRLLPLEKDFARMFYILCCVPVGNTVLSMSELLGEGQDIAANVVLLSTLLSMITIPAMLLLV